MSLSYPRDIGSIHLESGSWKLHSFNIDQEPVYKPLWDSPFHVDYGIEQIRLSYRGVCVGAISDYWDPGCTKAFVELKWDTFSISRIFGTVLFAGTEENYSFNRREASTDFRFSEDAVLLPTLPDRPEINQFLLAALKDEFVLLVMADWLEENGWAQPADEVRRTAAVRGQPQ